jgi:hypothetical protein
MECWRGRVNARVNRHGFLEGFCEVWSSACDLVYESTLLELVQEREVEVVVASVESVRWNGGR